MARYDKYQPESGGFRAQLAVNLPLDLDTPADNRVAIPLGVSLNPLGKLIVGTITGGTSLLGVLVADQPKFIGDVVDVMTNGEIVDLDEDSFDPGRTYYASTTTGFLSTTATGHRVGFTVGDTSPTDGSIHSRLVVRCVPAIQTA